jgi:hypothetical protein
MPSITGIVVWAGGEVDDCSEIGVPAVVRLDLG